MADLGPAPVAAQPYDPRTARHIHICVQGLFLNRNHSTHYERALPPGGG
jgi:hypothetical protein